MQTLVKLTFGIGVALIALFVYLFTAMERPSATQNGSFASRLGTPIRLAIVAEPAREARFRATLAAMDENQVIAADAMPNGYTEADAIVFLLEGWAKIQDAPWQERFTSDYAIIAGAQGDSFSLSMSDADRPLYRTYFNLMHDPEWRDECYAALLLHDLAGAPGQAIRLPNGC